MLVISNKTGIKARGDESEKEVVLVKTASDYWSYVMQNHREDYYTSDLYRDKADKILKELGD